MVDIIRSMRFSSLRIALLLLSATRSVATLAPPCRKCPEMQTLFVPVFASDGHLSRLQEDVFVFGGKGWQVDARQAMKPSMKSLVRNNKSSLGMFDDMWMTVVEDESVTWQAPLIQPAGEPITPGSRWKSGTATFNNGESLVLFGGCKGESVTDVQSDLWVLAPTLTIENPNDAAQGQAAWRRVLTANPPLARRGHVVATNSTHVIVFGGKATAKSVGEAHGGICIKDLWALPLSELNTATTSGRPTWTRGKDFPGPCSWGATGDVLTDAGGRENLILFGGRYEQTNGSYVYYNTVRLYDTAGDEWREIDVEGSQPDPRDHHAAAKIGAEYFIFAGRTKFTRDPDAVRADVWSYSLMRNLWTEHLPGDGPAPAARYMPGATSVTWEGNQALAIFGGETFPGSTKTSTRNDVWVYDLTAGRWHELQASDCNQQGEAFEHLFELSMALDIIERGVVFALASAMMGLLAVRTLTSRATASKTEDGVANGARYSQLPA